MGGGGGGGAGGMSLDNFKASEVGESCVLQVAGAPLLRGLFQQPPPAYFQGPSSPKAHPWFRAESF